MKRFFEGLLKILIGLGYAYLFLMGLLAVLYLVLSGSEVQGVVTFLIPPLVFLAVPFLLLGLLARRWVLLLANVVVLMAGFLVIYRPYLLPRSEVNIPADAPRLSVITFNLQASQGDLPEIASIIREANADIVGVQELTVSGADFLREALASDYAYMALYPQASNQYAGQGIFSHYPILDEDYWRNGQSVEYLGHLRVEIDVEGTPVTVYNAHPMPPWSGAWGLEAEAHHDEIQSVLERLDVDTGPVILLGDFNMTSQFDEYRDITDCYKDAYREAGDVGFGFTFPIFARTPFPAILRIDYIFYSPAFEGIDAYPLEESGGSDHLPVFAEIALVAPERGC